MTDTWEPDTPGVLELRSGRRIRGRALRDPLPPVSRPSFGLYLSAAARQPSSGKAAGSAGPTSGCQRIAQRPSRRCAKGWTGRAAKRVEVACGGGKGRTGTALALLAVMDGLPAELAVAYVRERYSAHAVETPWQRRFVARFRPPAGG